MSTKYSTRDSVTRAQYAKFFSMLKKAAENLGFETSQEVDDYRHKVMREEAGCESIKQLNRKADFDACIKRFAADAGDYLQAVEIGIQDAKRSAYVIKVMSVQIMQLTGAAENASRQYLEGIISQARIPCGVCLNDNSFFMDVSKQSIRLLLSILDSRRRKLIKKLFPGFPVKFDDTVRYSVTGQIRTRVTGVDRSYYENIPFRVNMV